MFALTRLVARARFHKFFWVAACPVVALLVLPTASASADSAISNGGQSADLATSISGGGGASPVWPRPYAILTFRVTVTNEGPDTVQNVVLADSLVFASLAGVVSNPTTVSCTSSGTLTCTDASLPAGGSMTVDLTVRESHSIPKQIAAYDSATVTSATPDPELTNNSASSYYEVI